MSGKYVYSAKEYVESVQLDHTVLVEQNVAWEEHADDCEETVSFVDADDALTETIDETYVTADDNNTTEYFSLDTTGETILNDISNVSLESSKNNGTLCSEKENDESIDVSNHQVVLFKIDDSDDLYGVQVAQDEDGNFQKYQFKVRQNEEGNLEAVPESIQILPLDNDCDEIADAETVAEENEEILQHEEVIEQAEEPASLFIKQEHVGEQFFEDVSSHEQIEEVEEEEEEETNTYERDTKEGILDVAASTVVHKQEVFDPEEAISETEVYGTEGTEQYFVQPPEDVDEDLHQSPDYFVSTEEVQDNEGDVEEEDEEPVIESSEPYEQLFVKENHIIEGKDMNNEELVEEVSVEPTFVEEQVFEEEPPFDEDFPFEEEPSFEEDTHHSYNSESLQENMHENESDNDYEIAEGSHITGETDNHLEEMHVNNELSAFEDNFGKQSPQTRKLIKNVIRKFKAKKNNEGNKIANTYYLIKHPEKENLGAATANVVLRPNPRSILKCSVTSVEPSKEIEDEIYEKRFAKSKEAQKARLFHNFIAQTKIIHAPIRQQRLPRKQQIKPMERTDEEIVVQEVVVCSNGFVETSEEGVLIERKSIKPTEYIQLSDSDEDYDPKAKHKRKRKHKKRKPIEITISDSEDDWSDSSVIEINESDSNEEEKNTAKRPRGRPRKNSVSADVNPRVEKDEHRENNIKRPRGRPRKTSKKSIEYDVDNDNSGDDIEEILIIVNTNNKCPKCPKSFSSEGSLRMHMQYHNFNEPNKDLAQEEVNKSKYKCDICDETFKNNFLLTKHTDLHNKKNKITCTICKKVFSDLSQLSKHKRTHIKQQMFKTTTVPKVTPKRVWMQKRKRTPGKPEIKCNDCSKVVSNVPALLTHSRMHKKYLCNSCGNKFPSNLMLQNHLRRSCVKKKTPKKRVSFSNRVSFLKPPTRMSSRVRPQRNSTAVASATEKANQDSTNPDSTNPIVTRSTVVTNIKCDSCPMTFATYTSLYKHKVSKHDLETPDKLVKNTNPPRTTLKPIGEHSGVPPSAKLKRAFRELRSKMEK